MSEVDWKEELEYSKDGVCEIHGHVLGFKICRGWNAKNPESPKTFRLTITERDIHGLVKPYKVWDFHTKKLQKLQIILPDSIEFLEAFFKFCLGYAEYLKEQYIAEGFHFLFNKTETGVVA